MKNNLLKTTLSCFLLFYGPHAFAGGQTSQSSSPPSVDTNSPSMGSSATGSSSSPNVSRSTDSRPQSSSPSRPSGQGSSSTPNVDTRSSTPSRSSGSSGSRGSSTSGSRSTTNNTSSNSGSGNTGSSRSGQSLNDSRASRDDDGDRRNRNRGVQNRGNGSLSKYESSSLPEGQNDSSSIEEESRPENTGSSSDTHNEEETKDNSVEDFKGEGKSQKNIGHRNRDDDSVGDEIRNEKRKKPNRKRLTIDGIEVVILENELGRSPMRVFPNTNSLEQIRRDLKRVGRKSALVYLLDRGMVIKVRANSKKLTRVKVRLRSVKYFILRSRFKGEPKGIRRDLPLIDVQGTRFIFETMEEALDFFSQPGHGQITSEGDIVPWEEHYIENRATGEIYEFNPKKGSLKKIPRDSIPYGRNIGGEYYEDPVDLLF